MGNSALFIKPTVIGECSVPAYCVKSAGSRHFIVAGGGGAVKTGVKNELELFLLTYNQTIGKSNVAQVLQAQQTGVINTSVYANMNMDCTCLTVPQHAKYLVAVGQDKYCTLYESTGFALSNDEQSSRLSLNFVSVYRFQTDWHSIDPYQKCVKIFRSDVSLDAPFRIATGGADGRVCVWNASNILDNYHRENPNFDSNLNKIQHAPKELTNIKPELEIKVHAGGEIDDLDVASSGQVLFIISEKKATLWDTKNGNKLLQLPEIPKLKTAMIRSLKFLNCGKSERNEIFICAYNQRACSKETALLALWAYDKRQIDFNLISVYKACHESVSCLAVNESGDFAAIGTMGGSVGVYDTHNLRPLYFSKCCHSSFVTSLDFLPQRSYDSCEWGRISPNDSNHFNEQNNVLAGQCFLPGVCSGEARAVVLSLSVDNSIQAHYVIYPPKSTISGTLLQIAMSTFIIYVILWFMFLF